MFKGQLSFYTYNLTILVDNLQKVSDCLGVSLLVLLHSWTRCHQVAQMVIMNIPSEYKKLFDSMKPHQLLVGVEFSTIPNLMSLPGNVDMLFNSPETSQIQEDHQEVG